MTWPEGVSDGLVLPCSDCGTAPWLDYHVPDDEWARVVPKDDEAHRSVLCLGCFMERGGRLATLVSADAINRHVETLRMRPERRWVWRGYYLASRHGGGDVA